MNVPFFVPAKYHLQMKFVVNALHFRNPTIFLKPVLPFFVHQNQQLGVQIIKTLHTPNCTQTKGSQCTCRESILCRTFVKRRLVIVSQVVQQCMGRRSTDSRVAKDGVPSRHWQLPQKLPQMVALNFSRPKLQWAKPLYAFMSLDSSRTVVPATESELSVRFLFHLISSY